MIVVAGGTGTLGTRLVPRLAGAGVAVRVLTRDPARAQHLAGHGVEVVRGDVRDPASVTAALRGADMVISAVHGFTGPGRVSPATVDRAGNANLIGAAARASANFILVSVAGAAPDHSIGLFRAKYAAEDMLRASGIGWTIVRATAFMQTWATIMSRMQEASGKIVVFGRAGPRCYAEAPRARADAGLGIRAYVPGRSWPGSCVAESIGSGDPGVSAGCLAGVMPGGGDENVAVE